MDIDPDLRVRAAMSTDAQLPPRSFLTIAGGVLIFLAVVLLIYFAYLTTRPVLLALVAAAAIASLATRFFAWLVRRLRGRRRLAAVLAVLTLSVCVFAPFGILGTVVVQRLVVEGTQTFDVREWDLRLPRLGFLRVHPDVQVRVRLVADRAG